jgi:hypothetical protein
MLLSSWILAYVTLQKEEAGKQNVAGAVSATFLESMNLPYFP